MARPNEDTTSRRFPPTLSRAKLRLKELMLEKARIDCDVEDIKEHIKELKAQAELDDAHGGS